MRKLTVKNFSVIKEAELEFGKITVLIGPQSSGKSLLCKLAYFLGKELVELAVSSILDGTPWNEYLNAATKGFRARFFEDRLVSEKTEARFSSFGYEVSLSWEHGSSDLRFQFSEEFQQQFDVLTNSFYLDAPAASGAFLPGGISSSRRQEDIWIGLNTVLADPAADPVLDGILYVPAGRAFFTNLSKGSAVLQNLGLDSITREFSAQIQWDPRWGEGMFASRRGVTDEVKQAMTRIAGGLIVMDSGVPSFLASDGRKLPLEVLSTGNQELIPLFNILERLMITREHLVEGAKVRYAQAHNRRPVTSRSLLYLEEPEANIFPRTQYELVQLFSWLASDPILDFSWVITTHSPYIMTAFNTLIEAGRVGSLPENREKVNTVIPEQYWIKESDFKAYAIEDGILISIFKPEAEDPDGEGMINGDYLDSVSDQLGKEFNRLLDIEFAK